MLLSSPSLADVVDDRRMFLQWGVSLAHPGVEKPDEVKWGEMGMAGEYKRMAYTIGLGYWNDHTKYDPNDKKTHKSKFPLAGYGELDGVSRQARSSPYVEALFGVEPRTEHLYVSYKLGPAFVLLPDVLLGGYLQLGQEVGIGIYDGRNVRVGIVYKHYSDAGFTKFNHGRDLLGLRIEF